jgi:hypothetical protein
MVAGSGLHSDAGPGARVLGIPPRQTPQPRGSEPTHPDHVSVVESEVAPSGPRAASRDPAKRRDTLTGTQVSRGEASAGGVLPSLRVPRGWPQNGSQDGYQ